MSSYAFFCSGCQTDFTIPLFSTLPYYYKKIKEQREALQEKETYFKSSSLLPINYIRPTIQLLLKLRGLLQRVHFCCCKTELDLAYLKKLSYYCQQIDKHIKSLHHMETYFEASSLLLTNCIFPTTKFLSILKQVLQCFMHIHERDTVRYI